MQTFWSTASRVKCTCRCGLCLSKGPFTSRRATIATARKLVLANPSSTFLYSTIFAAAVVADAKAKRDRRERWEVLIDDIKQSWTSKPAKLLEQDTEPVEPEGLVVTNELDDEGKRETLVGSIENVIRKESLGQKQGEVLSPSGMTHYPRMLDLDSLLPGTPRPLWPANTGPALNRHHLPPQSLWSTESARSKSLDSEWSEKKIRLSENGVTAFIIRMILESNICGRSIDESMEHPEAIRSLIMRPRDELAQLLRENVKYRSQICETSPDAVHKIPYPQQFLVRYEQSTKEAIARVSIERKTALKRVLALRKENQISQKLFVSHTCDILASFPAPPDVATYNFLLMAGGQLKLKEMKDHVIKTVLDTNTRPNEITCASSLHHYTQTGNADGFNKFVERMRGSRGGLMLARSDIKVTPASKGRLLRHSESKVVQKVFPTPMVFNALMEGVLRFAGFNRAIEIYSDLKTDGWGLDKQGLSLFLRECIRRRNWEGGMIVWDQMKMLQLQGKNKKVESDNALLRKLCKVCGRGSQYGNLLIT